jgi:hypothetical protein
MRARFIKQIGIRGQLRIYWDKVRATKIYPEDKYFSSESLHDCPNTYGKQGQRGIHNAYTPLGDKLNTEDWSVFGKTGDYPAQQWPTACAHCGAPVPEKQFPTNIGDEVWDVTHQVFTSRLYNTASGKPEPGDVYWVNYHPDRQCPWWDNCSGMHLYGVLPTGYDWDIDGRANNCTMPKDRQHRCWVRTGSPENGALHVDKNGNTCAAGAGSIMTKDWHGFLHHFKWRT